MTGVDPTDPNLRWHYDDYEHSFFDVPDNHIYRPLPHFFKDEPVVSLIERIASGQTLREFFGIGDFTLSVDPNASLSDFQYTPYIEQTEIRLRGESLERFQSGTYFDWNNFEIPIAISE